MGYVGDDYVALQGIDEPVAWSLYSTGKLDDRSLEMLGGLKDVPRGAPGENPPKDVLRMAGAPGVRVLRGAPLAAIVLPRQGALPGLRSVGAAGALRTLATASVLQIPRDAQAAIRFMAALVRRLPVYELGLDGGPMQAARDVAGLVDGLERA
jgi:hypothetical protein